MSASDLGQVIDQYPRAVEVFTRGDPEPSKKLFSRRGDVTLANPLGPPALGWKQVEKALDQAASQIREGEPVRFDQVSGHETPDLAYTLVIQRTRAKMGDSTEMADFSLRVTTIFRREEGEWKVVHRHADPIMSPRQASSVLQQ